MPFLIRHQVVPTECPEHQAAETSRGRRRWLLAAGTAVTVLPGGGIAIAIHARPAAYLAFTLTFVVAGATTILLSREETRRTELTLHSSNVIADALADGIHAAFNKATDLSASEAIDEAERTRASAYLLLTNLLAPILVAFTRAAKPANGESLAQAAPSSGDNDNSHPATNEPILTSSQEKPPTYQAGSVQSHA